MVCPSLEYGNFHADSEGRLQFLGDAAGVGGEEGAHLHAHTALFRRPGVNLSVVAEGVVGLYLVAQARGGIDVW